VDTALPVDVFTLDLFDTPRATLDAIHARGGWVLCYFSAGTLEAGRPDSSLIPDSARGEPARRANEVWLDVRTTSVREWALGRLDRAKNLGCDGVHPTSIDGYLEGPATGFPWDEATSLSYVRFLASEARARGLLAGLVNSVELAAALAPDVDFAANEECLRFDECARLADFVRLGKPVFHLEYVADAADGAATLEQVCADPTRSKFNTILKLGPSAGAWLLACE
jgi:hypothetical protein